MIGCRLEPVVVMLYMDHNRGNPMKMSSYHIEKVHIYVTYIVLP